MRIQNRGATDLVSDDGLLNGSEVLEGGQKDVTPCRAADIFNKAAELLAQGDENFIFILNGLCDAKVSGRADRAGNFLVRHEGTQASGVRAGRQVR